MTADGQTATLTVATENPDGLLAALEPDLGAIPGDATVEASIADGELELRLRGPDISSLRAAVGTWTKLVAVASSADRRADAGAGSSTSDR